MLSKANASTMSKASFVVMAPPPNGHSARGRRRLRSSRTAANEMLAVVSAIAMISFSFQSLMRELWYGVALHRLHRSPFDCFCSKGRIRAPSKAWLPGSPASSQRSLAGDLNRGIDGVFEILRVVGRGLVSVAAAHAKSPERTLRRVSPRCRAIDLASWSVMARQCPVDARSLAVVRLSRFAPRAGLVTLRQILVRRCHRGKCRLPGAQG